MELQSLENINEILSDIKNTVDIEVFSSIKNINEFLDVSNPDRSLKFEMKTKVKLPQRKSNITLMIFCFDDCIVFGSEKSGYFSKNPRYFILKSYFFTKDVTGYHLQDNFVTIYGHFFGEFVSYTIFDLSEEQCAAWNNFIKIQEKSNSPSLLKVEILLKSNKKYGFSLRANLISNFF